MCFIKVLLTRWAHVANVLLMYFYDYTVPDVRTIPKIQQSPSDAHLESFGQIVPRAVMRLVRALVRGHAVHRGQEEPSITERVAGILGPEAEVWRHPCVHLHGKVARVSVSNLLKQPAFATVPCQFLSTTYLGDGSTTLLHRLVALWCSTTKASIEGCVQIFCRDDEVVGTHLA